MSEREVKSTMTDNNQAHAFGEILQSILENSEMTQAQLARLIGKDPKNVSQWIQGKANPNYAALIDIANSTGTSGNKLLGLPNTDYYEGLFSGILYQSMVSDGRSASLRLSGDLFWLCLVYVQSKSLLHHISDEILEIVKLINEAFATGNYRVSIRMTAYLSHVQSNLAQFEGANGRIDLSKQAIQSLDKLIAEVQPKLYNEEEVTELTRLRFFFEIDGVGYSLLEIGQVGEAQELFKRTAANANKGNFVDCYVISIIFLVICMVEVEEPSEEDFADASKLLEEAQSILEGMLRNQLTEFVFDELYVRFYLAYVKYEVARGEFWSALDYLTRMEKHATIPNLISYLRGEVYLEIARSIPISPDIRSGRHYNIALAEEELSKVNPVSDIASEHIRDRLKSKDIKESNNDSSLSKKNLGSNDIPDTDFVRIEFVRLKILEMYSEMYRDESKKILEYGLKCAEDMLVDHCGDMDDKFKLKNDLKKLIDHFDTLLAEM